VVTDVFVSIVRTWRFTDGTGRTAAFYDLSAHRHRMGELRGGSGTGSFALPWPPFRSRYWQYACNRDDYANTPPKVLVAALVPQRAMVPVVFGSPSRTRAPLGEAFLQPFGLSTVVTVDLLGATSWDPHVAATQLDDALRTPTDQPPPAVSPRLLRDGIRVADVEAAAPDNPWQAMGLSTEEAGEIVIVSGLSSPGADVAANAALMANQFAAGGTATTHALTRSQGAIAVTSGRVGIALDASLPRASARVKCLHHNHTLLLSQLASLGSIMAPPPTLTAEPFQRIAAGVLNHLHRGEVIPGAGVYKSRTAPSWLAKKGLLASIDHVNAAAGSGLPVLIPPPNTS
jgi:hypothetical protein